MSQVVCLYHDDCFDGLGSAWALTKRFPDALLINVRYNEPSPMGLEGKIVYIVDFCYPLSELVAISLVVEELHILDHHKGMEQTVADFNWWVKFQGWDTEKFNGLFDKTRSGAKLTWETLMPEYCTPAIIDFISDRDLWKFELDETELVMAGLSAYPLDIEVWDRLFRWDENFNNKAEFHLDRIQPDIHPHYQVINELHQDGYVVLRKMNTDVDRMIGLAKRSIELEGHTVPFINVPRMLSSEALAKLAIGQPFAVGYFDKEDCREFSLRSAPEGVEVISIAKAYGGGGHPNAAGFRVPRDHPLAQL